MTFGWHVGSFTKSTTTTGFPFNQDITSASITGTPILAIVWTSFTTADAAYQDTNDVGFAIGFATQAATAGKMHSIGCFEDDGAAASTSWHWLVNNSSTAWMRRYGATGTLASEFHLNSFLSNGFRITYNATNDNRADIYNYLVVWGTDWTVNSGSYQAPTVAGESVTAHGLGATPLFVMQMTGRSATNNDSQNDGTLSIGMASGTAVASQRCMNITVENGRTTMDTGRYMPVDKVMGIVSETVTTTIDAIANLSAWDATNFNTNWTDPSSIASRISWLAITGGKHDVHGMTAPASIGNQSKTGLSFQPEGLFAFSRGATATTTADAHALISVGAAKSSSLHRNALYCSEDNTANAEALVRSSSAYIIETSPTAVAAIASSTAAPNMQIELVQFNSDGYTWNYDATVSGFITAVWSFGPTGSSAFTRDITEPAVPVSDSISRRLAANRTISEPSVALSDSISRGIGRTIAETAIPVSDSISRGIGRKITEPNILIDDTLSRTPNLNVNINEAPVPVSDSLARNITISIALSEPSVAVSDSLGGAGGKSGIITEPAVTMQGEANFDDQNFDLQNFGLEDFLQTQLGAGRIISETSIAVSDSLAVQRSISISITEPAVDIADSIARQLAANRTLLDTVLVSDTVSRGQVFTRDIIEAAILVSDSIAAGLAPSRSSRRAPRTSKKTGTGKTPKRESGDVSI